MKKTILLISIFIYQISIACSAFYYNGENKILAKNFDWGFGQGYLIKNIRGQQKYSYGFRGNNVAGWISKFGSITFNQNGKEFPYGGINEKGLVVEQLWLGNTEYQENNNKTISELEWIQYQLDNYEKVDEVIENINSLTIKPIARIHYFLADKNGVSAVIDFVNGGKKYDVTYVSKVEDADGNAIYEKSDGYKQAISESTAYVMNRMMQNVITQQDGTGRYAKLNNTDLVGKTGTSSDWFGITHIYCSQDTADVYNPKVVQATMGSIARVKVEYGDLLGLVESLPADVPVYGTLLDGDNIYQQKLENRGLIVMGNEGKGISPALAKKVNHKLLIPNFPEGRATADSLNVAIATAITCSEFRRNF
jgi:tRNA(Leu) C34 or U34 (ribose-2'-O)-methylase TrmL